MIRTRVLKSQKGSSLYLSTEREIHVYQTNHGRYGIGLDGAYFAAYFTAAELISFLEDALATVIEQEKRPIWHFEE